MDMADIEKLYSLASCLQKGLHKMAASLLGDHMPYGLWRTSGGREILFDRGYQPLWQRTANGRVSAADRNEYVNDKAHSEIFYRDVDHCYLDYAGMKRLRGVLVRWGLIPPNKQESKARWDEFRRRRRRRQREREIRGHI
jgi:hypothetical protein